MEMKILSRVSDEAGAFVLEGSTGHCMCIVSVEENTSGRGIDWLRDALAERFERTIVRGAASDEKATLAGFFQSSHRRVYREIEERGREIGRVSMVVVYARGKRVVLASVGNCAAYRLGGSGAELLLPPEASAAEPSFLGQTLKVRVEMTTQTAYPGISYVCTSERIDELPDWGVFLEELADGTLPSAETITNRVLESGCGAVGVMEIPAGAWEVGRADEDWYKELRAELTRAASQGSPEKPPRKWSRQKAKRPRTVRPLQKVSFVLAAATIVLLLYAVWIHWAEPRLRGVGGEDRDEPDSIASEGAMSGALSLGWIPPGAEILLDGEPVALGREAEALSASVGSHRVTVRHGELGEWVGDVVLQAGDTTLVDVELKGDIAVGSGAKRGLSVLVDGELKGRTPCLVKGVPAGLHVVTVGGKDFGPWEEEVLVAHDGVAEVYVNPGRVSERGTVRVTSSRMTRDGYEESTGDAVFIDGTKRGATPFETQLRPGLHSVRVSGTADTPPSVRVLEVRAGGKHFVRAELGGVEPLLIDCREVKTEGEDALVIHASLSGRTDLEIAEVTLYLQKSTQRRGLWQPMLLVPGSRAVYAAAVPEEMLIPQTKLEYFARATTSQGLEYFSDMNTVTPE